MKIHNEEQLRGCLQRRSLRAETIDALISDYQELQAGTKTLSSFSSIQDDDAEYVSLREIFENLGVEV